MRRLGISVAASALLLVAPQAASAQGAGIDPGRDGTTKWMVDQHFEKAIHTDTDYIGTKGPVEVHVFLSGTDVIGCAFLLRSAPTGSARDDLSAWATLFAPGSDAIVRDWSKGWGAEPLEQIASLGDRELYANTQFDPAKDIYLVELRVAQDGRVLPAPFDFGTHEAAAPQSGVSQEREGGHAFNGRGDYNTPKFFLAVG